MKDLSVALLLHHMLRCSVFKVQLPASFEARSQNPIPWVLRSNAKLESWWARVGSNHRPYDYQSYALASWATGPFVDTSSISLAALHAVRLAHFATSPLPRRPASLGSARILNDWLLYCFFVPRKSVCFCGMVEIVGIEPATSCLQGRRSPS